jgi:hypothetical protein
VVIVFKIDWSRDLNLLACYALLSGRWWSDIVGVFSVPQDLFIMKPTRCTNFSNLFLKWKSTCFGQFLCPSSGVFHCTHSNGICHKPLLRVHQKTPDDGQNNCSKYVDFHSKNKFEKLLHLVGFIIRNLSWCTVARMSKSHTTCILINRVVRSLQLAWSDLSFFRDYQYIEPRTVNVVTACLQIYTKIKIGSSAREVHYHIELSRIYMLLCNL